MTGLRAMVKSLLRSDAGGAFGVGNETFVIDVRSRLPKPKLSPLKILKLRDLLMGRVLAGLHLMFLTLFDSFAPRASTSSIR